MLPRIENWGIVSDDDPWIAPEMRTQMFSGNIYNHPDFKDGTHVTTSSWIDYNEDERTIITAAGRTIVLGKPDKSYVKWCKDNGVHIPTAECPIKDFRKN